MKPELARWRVPAMIVVLLTVEALASIFFFGDAASKLQNASDKRNPLTELPVALTLIISILFTFREMKIVLQRAMAQASAPALAKGEFVRVMDIRFDLWKLTSAGR